MKIKTLSDLSFTQLYTCDVLDNLIITAQPVAGTYYHNIN